jgi:hypothetical protein
LYNYQALFLSLDYIGDAFFFADIIINFRMTYMDHGIVHTDTKKIAIRYLKTGFVRDALSIIPSGNTKLISFALNISRFLRHRYTMEALLITSKSIDSF